MWFMRTFGVNSFLSLSLCVCLITVVWCIFIFHSGCRHKADRFPVGFVGLLSIYHAIQILRGMNLFAFAPLEKADDAVDFLVTSLYLMAGLVLRRSNQERRTIGVRLR